MATNSRRVARIIDSTRLLEGGGFPVRRPFPSRDLQQIDPFLLLDEMGPVEYAPGAAIGAPDHPHRGFETVTYLLAGGMQHRDSQGHAGQLNPGDVQWMTAGSGVVHSEMPEPDFARRGGLMHGFQLWVNLPRRAKMSPPRYQDLAASRIPVVEAAQGRAQVRVIAGSVLGTRASTETHVPILYAHATLEPGAELEIEVPRQQTAFAYLFGGGSGRFGAESREASDGQELVEFAADADTIRIACAATASQSLDLLLLAAEPIGEPMVRYGPFVMNTKAEIHQAIEDFQTGRMGQIPAAPPRRPGGGSA